MYRTLLRLQFIVILLFVSAHSAFAGSFVVKQIEISGLHRVSKETVASYLPVKVGQVFNTQDSASVIRTLYKTDFFSNISLLRDGGKLLVKLQERPTISALTFSGNKNIPEDKLKEVLNNLGLVKGRFFNPAMLTQVQQALTNQYFATGRYNARIKVSQLVEPRNRIAVSVKISEGTVAKIAGINFTGNVNYPDSELTSQLALSTLNIKSFFSGTDKFSEQGLQTSQQNLQSFYFNRGYLKFAVEHTNVALTPNRKGIYLNFKVNEGPQYHFSGYTIKGNLGKQAEAVKKAITITKGDVFSRQKLIGIVQSVQAIFGNAGYAFATVKPEPKIDDKTRTVGVTFVVDRGRQYYIRRINLLGNNTTADLAVRKQLYQLEGAKFSRSQLQNSMFRLRQNPYFSPAQPPQIIPKKVEGRNNQVDLDVSVAEKLSAQIQASIGYSQVYGLLLSTGINQPNFLGTGKTLGFNINFSSFQRSFSLSYTNPFYTLDGVSRTVSITGTQTNASELNIASYSTNNYGVNINYSFPLSVYNSLNIGYGVGYTQLQVPPPAASVKDADDCRNPNLSVYQRFVNCYGSNFTQATINGGWSRRTLDNPILPTKGTSQSVNLTVAIPLLNHGLQYYRATYTHDWYRPLGSNMILRTHGVLGYGNGYGSMKSLPFFQNYFAGGIGVQGLNRAFQPFSLGPQDSTNQQQIGGNLLVSGMTSIIFPHLFKSRTLRPSIFMDVGNVFTTNNDLLTNASQYTFSLNQMRVSAGVQLEWWTPLNIPLIFSYAVPVADQPGDQLQPFQFTIGTLF